MYAIRSYYEDCTLQIGGGDQFGNITAGKLYEDSAFFARAAEAYSYHFV